MKNTLPLSIYAQVLAQKLKINVSFSGKTAFASQKDGRGLINLPAIEMDDPEPLWGYLYHEAFHQSDSDFELFRSIKDPLRSNLLNIVEDIRNEYLMPYRYGTAGRAIDAMNQSILERGKFPVPSDSDVEGIVPWLILYRGLHLNGFKAIESNYSATKSIAEEVFGSELVFKLLYELESRHALLESTQDALDCVDAIIGHLVASSQSPDQSGDQSGDSSSEESQATGDQSGDSSSEESQATGDQSCDSSSEESQATGDQAGDSSSEESQATGDQAGDSKAQAIAALRAVEATMNDLPDQKMSNFESIIKNDIVPSSDIGDEVFCSCDPVKGNADKPTSQLAESKRDSSAVQKRLRDILVGSSDKKFLSNSGKRLSSSRAYRLSQYDTKVFTRTIKSPSVSASVHVLLDNSSSMKNTDGKSVTRMECAIKAVLSLVSAIDRTPNCDIAVSSFPASTAEGYGVTQVLKRGQPLRKNISNFDIFPSGGTPLLQSLGYAYGELASVKNDKKLLIVVTDGQVRREKDVVALSAKMKMFGIDTCAIGINIGSIRSVFENSAVLSDATSLERAVFEITQSTLAV